MTMGRQGIVDKTVHPLTISSITPAGVVSDASRAGVIPIGNYKGAAAFWDLDKAVNQPLVLAEKQHILGVLDGRLEGYDLVTINIPTGVATPVGTVYRGRLTVPAGQVWFVTAVVVVFGAVEAATPNGWWRCSQFPAPALAPDADGQAFNAAAMTLALMPPGGYIDEFWSGANIIIPVLPTNKPVELRLPARASVTLQLVTTVLGTTGSAYTLSLFGYVGRTLVAE